MRLICFFFILVFSFFQYSYVLAEKGERYQVKYQVIGASSGDKTVTADSASEAEREVRLQLEARPEFKGKKIIIKEIKKR